jgi:hypothetical protein
MTQLTFLQRQNCGGSNGSSSTSPQLSLRFLFVGFFIFMLLASQASAFGIKPAQASLAFEPYLEYTGQFNIIREQAEASEAKLSAEGDLAPYISFDQEYVTLSGQETSIRYHLHLPEKLKPGQYVGIVVVEEHAIQGAGISSQVRLPYKIYVTVPHDDDDVDGDVDVQEQNGQLVITTTVTNYGTSALSSVQPVVTIERSGTLLTTLTLDAQPVAAGATVVFTKTIESPTKEGVYLATADIKHDNGEIEVMKQFVIGFPTIALKGHTPYLRAREINAFNITLQNEWNAPIDGIVADFRLEANGTVVASLRSEHIYLDTGERKGVKSYLDLRSVAPGTYDGILTLTYPQGAEEERFSVDVLDHEPEKGRALIIGMMVLGLVNAALIILLVVKWRRKRHNK